MVQQIQSTCTDCGGTGDFVREKDRCKKCKGKKLNEVDYKLEVHIYTSNKKHFMKNVKECRDVIVKKVLEQGWDTRTTHYTHVGPMTPYIVV